MSAAVAFDDQGCTCFLGHPPCGWCENAPDPDSEEGLRREVDRLRADLRLEKDKSEMRLRQIEHLKRDLMERADVARAANKLAAEAKQIDLQLARERSFALGCLAAALGCVGALAAERNPRIEGSRFSWIEVN